MAVAGTPGGRAWHDTQDDQITVALEALDRVFVHSSAVRRVWGLTSDFIADKHLLNVHAVKRRDDAFRLLDVGCGTGELIARLAPQFPHAEFVGLDSNGPSIARALARGVPRSTFICATFEKARGPFDMVVCSEMFEHVLDSDGLLDALHDLVAANGHLSISTPSGWMFRSPRLYNVYKFLRGPRRFVRLYLRPEDHWPEALTIHPAVLPSKLRRRVEQRGFSLTLRQSSLWWLEEFGVAYRTFRALERFDGPRAASAFFHLTQMLEGAMNLLPPLRLFESRAVLLMQKTRRPPDRSHADRT